MTDRLEIKESDSNESDHLDRLALFLNYEISASILFGLSFFAGTFLIIAMIVAGVFIPYMIYVLLKEGRHGWIIFFNVLVIMPIVLSLLFLPEYSSIFLLISVGMFYCYCFLLRMSANEWIRDRNWRLQLEQQRKDLKKGV